MTINVCEYKNYQVNLNAHGMFFSEGIGDGYTSFSTYEEIKKAIDEASKVKFKPIDGFIVRNQEVLQVLITRPYKPSYGTELHHWITHKSTKRRETTSSAIIDNEKTRSLLSEYLLNLKKVNEHQKECNSLLKLMRDEQIVFEEIKGKK